MDFAYELLPTFCYYCGIIGHAEKICDRKIGDARTDSLCEGQYGQWLRVSPGKGGKREEPLNYGQSKGLTTSLGTHRNMSLNRDDQD